MDYSINFKNELTHHGTRGQKWGIRNYQNLDGSLTAEGRKRYGIGDGVKKVAKVAKVAPDAIEKTYKKTRSAVKKTYKAGRTVIKDGYSATKTVKDDLTSAIKTVSGRKRNEKTKVTKDVKNRSHLDDRELNYRIERLRKERELISLNNEVNHPTAKIVSESGKKLAATALVGIGAYGLNYAVKNYGPEIGKKSKTLSKVNWNELASWAFPNPNSKKKK